MYIIYNYVCILYIIMYVYIYIYVKMLILNIDAHMCKYYCILHQY